MCSFKTCSCTASVNCHDTAITTVVIIADDCNYKMLISMMYCNTEFMIFEFDMLVDYMFVGKILVFD